MSRVDAGSPSRRLLFLTPFPPRLDGAHGGSRVTAQLLTRLSSRHRVALLCLKAPEELGVDRGLRERCDLVEEVERLVISTSVLRAWSERRRIGLMLQGASPWVTSRAVAAFGPRVRAVVESWRPEVVQLEHHAMAQYLPDLRSPSSVRIFVEHDPPRAREAGALDRQGRWWRRYERVALRQADASVVFTERDRQTLQELEPAARIVRIPLGADVPQQAADAEGDGMTVLFVGSFAHPPNVDAAVRLARSILPAVREQTDARLVLVGDAPPRLVRDLASEYVTVTGWVRDLRPYLDRSAVVVAPLRLGGGMRVKVLDALAAGKAIVASSLALAGLALEDGVQVVVADGDVETAQAVAGLLDDPARRIALAGAGRTWASRNLDWERVAESYEALYESLAQAAR